MSRNRPHSKPKSDPAPTAAVLRAALEKEIAAQEMAANIALEAFCRERGINLGVTMNYMGQQQSIVISCVSQRRRELPTALTGSAG